MRTFSANDRLSLSSVEVAQYDVVIVGAGTIGLLLASELVRRGQHVCLVEAGGRSAVAPEGIFASPSIGRPHAGARLGRAIGLGGTSTLWGGQLARFVPPDLTRDGFAWPIGWDELDRYYAKTDKALGLSPIRSDPDYLRAFGNDALLGDIEVYYSRWLPQPDLAQVLRRPLAATEALDLVLDGVAHGFAVEGDRVASVALSSPDGRVTHLRGRSVVLAAGTIGNVQVMLSAARHAPVPWRDNRAIGTYFQDHLGGVAARVEVLDDAAFRRLFENGRRDRTKLSPRVRSRHRAAEQPSVSAFFQFHTSTGDAFDQLKHAMRRVRRSPSASDLRQLSAAAFGLGRAIGPIAARYLHARRIRALYDGGIDFVVQAEQWPVPNSRIAADGDTLDRSGLLPVTVDWRLDGREGPAIGRFVSAAGESLAAAGIARLSPADWLMRGAEPDLTSLGDTYHQSGGLCMATRDNGGVTDRDLRVIGTRNLYVAGASVLPTSSHANCTFTAMALAVRLADHLGKRR